MLSAHAARFLDAAVVAGLNVVVSRGTRTVVDILLRDGC